MHKLVLFYSKETPIQGSHSFTDKKSMTFPGLSRNPHKFFTTCIVVFGARECLNIKGIKTTFTCNEYVTPKWQNSSTFYTVFK